LNDVPTKTLSRIKNSTFLSAQSVFRTALSTSRWLRRAIWAWPIIAAAILAIIAVSLRLIVEQKLEDELAGKLETILKADVEALKLWMRGQEASALSAAMDRSVVSHAERLISRVAARPETTQLDLLQSEELNALRHELAPICEAEGFNGWMLVNPQHRIVASLRNEVVGIECPKEDRPYVDRTLQGTPTVSPPRKSLVLLPDEHGELKSGLPTMHAWAPIRAADGATIAVLGMRIPPEREFVRILQIAWSGRTGETYAVAHDARMVTSSRFNEQLRQIGLLTEDEDSLLNITLRDPGVDLTTGKRPAQTRSHQPLNRVGESLTAGKSEVDVIGHRDYRGVWCVGAWTWLPDYELGVVTEQDSSEAFAVLAVMRWVFGSLFVLLILSAAGIFICMLVMQRQNREAQRAALELRRLGQYTLDEKLGEGGMGVVYRGHHAMLHRPTAVKFLHVEKTNEQTIARFEREVQLTARLTHPNTIAVYDYGRTPEGIFYYAMEYLEGIDLDELVRRHGPLPDGRVIFLLQQICGSLTEAHGIGLIHRDIKPANVFLTTRGGLFDFVKLLDFGLVRALDEEKNARLTSTGALAGTPLYLSPEAIEHPDAMDARSDLYAVGAVGYFLLTGVPVFDGRTVVEIVQKHAAAVPDPPSRRLGKPVSAHLEDLLMRCLRKSPDQRPQSATELADALAACAPITRWTSKDAAAWWAEHFTGASRSEDRSSAITSALGETILSTPSG
jgi:hypothetical protein